MAMTLIVEDNEAVRESMESLFEMWGEVASFSNVPSALRAYEAGLEIDGVLTDFDLGVGPTGLDLVKSLREMGFEGKIAIYSGDTSKIPAESETMQGVGVFAKGGTDCTTGVAKFLGLIE
jgi:DNA-binding NtrC family response regulator